MMIRLLISISLHVLAMSATQAPTSSPLEFSNVTVYNDGGTYTIDDSSHGGEVFVITQKTKLIIKEGGDVTAPSNSDWPAIRLSVGSSLNATGGTITGSKAANGGEAVQLNNGQSSTDTAGYAEFYDGVKIVGGDAIDGVGGDSLVVNGFGTEAIIFGGNFISGSGAVADGDSVRVLNSAVAHIHGGTFNGDMVVEENGLIVLHGCFLIKNGTQVNGIFADESELTVDIKSDRGGTIDFSVPEQLECDTAPSVAPTSFPTLSPQPTVVQRNGDRKFAASAIVAILNLISCSILCFDISY